MDEILKAALNSAAQVDSSPVPADDTSADTADPDHADGRKAALEHALDGLSAGSPRAVEDGLIDLLGAELLEALLNGNAAGLDVVSEDVYQAQEAAERGTVLVEGASALELAETAGALRALSWLARLAAEQLIGPALIDLDTHAGRMLAAIGARAGVTNSALMIELELDKTQVSRTGRRLIEAGLAVSARSGKANAWRVTPKGDFTLTAAAAAAEHSDTSEHSRPLLIEAVEGFTSSGYEVIPIADADVDDLQVSAFADGQAIVASRLSAVAKAARGALTVSKGQLGELISGVPETVRILRPTTPRSTKTVEIIVGKGMKFSGTERPPRTVAEFDRQIDALKRARDALAAGKTIDLPHGGRVYKARFEGYKGAPVRKR